MSANDFCLFESRRKGAANAMDHLGLKPLPEPRKSWLQLVFSLLKRLALRQTVNCAL
jgi:hypothetical protein